MLNLKNTRNLRECLVILLMTFFGFYLSGIPISLSGKLAAAENQLSTKQINEAEESYFNGEFEKAIELVNLSLSDPKLPKPDQMKAYTILARIYVAKDELNQAKENIRNILKIDPNYQPTIEQEMPIFVSLVSQVKKENSDKKAVPAKSGIKKWLLLGAGGAAAAAVIVLVANGGKEKGSESNPLPEPPSFP